jgi:alpha-1,6-mannosyltransferase
LVGLNPVIVLFGVGGGHNDLLMLAILAAGLYVMLRQQELPSGILMVTAIAVKLTAGLLLPFALAAQGGRAGRPERRRLLIGAGLAAVVILGLAYALFGVGPLQMPSTLQGIQSEGGPHSIVGFPAEALGLPGLVGPAETVLTVVFLLALAWLVRRVWRGELDWIAGAGWATVVLLLTTGFLVPWYVAWLIPLAALSHDRRLLFAAIALTGIGLTTL